MADRGWTLGTQAGRARCDVRLAGKVVATPFPSFLPCHCVALRLRRFFLPHSA